MTVVGSDRKVNPNHVDAGADISVVARQLGHSDIKTTARYYLRPDLSVLKSLQRAWERLIIGVA